MKRLLSSFVLIFLAGLAVFAESVSIPNPQGVEIWYNIDEKNGVAEVTFKGKTYGEVADEYSGTLIIPEEVTYNGETYTVSSIGGNAFADCKNLTGITIPEKVTRIGGHAFRGCVSLSQVNFNAINCVDAAEQKGGKTYAAFEDCKSITNLNFGDKVVYIPDYAFWGCSGIKEITIPENVKKIGGGAFYDCTGITKIVFNAANCLSAASNLNGKNVPAFMNTSVSVVEIGPLVTSIPDYAFFGCKGLSTITIPESVTRIGGGAFRECSNLTSVNFNAVHCSTSFSTSGESVLPAFGNPSITTVVFGNKVEEVPNYLFWGCKGLTNVTFTENIKSIGNAAFYDCISLQSVEIPSGVTSIGGHAFKGCSNLATVNFGAVYCTNAATMEKGQLQPAFENASITTVVFAEDVKNIPDNAFANCSGLVNITLSGALQTIGENAFLNCTSLKTITIPKNVTSIGGRAFAGCDNLNTVHFDAVRCTGASKVEGTLHIPAFLKCAALEDIIFGDSVEIIPDYLLSGCENLKRLTIPANVTTIGGHSFDDCANLDVINFNAAACTNLTTAEEGGAVSAFGTQSVTTVNIGNAVKIIPDRAFLGCRRLSVLNLPASVERIGNMAFADCSALKKVVIPENVVSIGGDAFRGCTSLESVVFNAVKCTNVMQMVDGVVVPAFNNEDIESVSFGSKVETIPDYLFYGCSGISKLNIPKNVTRIGAFAFYNCAALSELTIPENVTNIGGGAFGECKRLETVNYNAIRCTNAMTVTEDSIIPAFNCPSIKNIIINKKVESLPEYLFYGSTNLKSLLIPKGVTSIGGNAFGNCLSLKEIEFYALNCVSTSTVMGDSVVTAFNNCPAVMTVTLDEKLEAIPDYAFYGFKGMKRITIPEKVTKIGDYAFYGCELLPRVNLSEKVTSIGKYAFYGSGISTMTLSPSITEIGECAFAGCKKLGNINVKKGNEYYVSVGGALYDKGKTVLMQYPTTRQNPKFVVEKTVTHIDSEAFAGITGVSEVVLPEGVVSMGADVFKGSKNIRRIVIDAVNPPSLDGPLCDETSLNCTLKVPEGSVQAYLTNAFWKIFTTITEY